MLQIDRVTADVDVRPAAASGAAPAPSVAALLNEPDTRERVKEIVRELFREQLRELERQGTI
jgi:hypothetical protein